MPAPVGSRPPQQVHVGLNLERAIRAEARRQVEVVHDPDHLFYHAFIPSDVAMNLIFETFGVNSLEELFRGGANDANFKELVSFHVGYIDRNEFHSDEGTAFPVETQPPPREHFVDNVDGINVYQRFSTITTEQHHGTTILYYFVDGILSNEQFTGRLFELSGQPHEEAPHQGPPNRLYELAPY